MQAVLQSPKPWFTEERGVWIAAIFLVGAVAFGYGNGHTTENSIASISNNLGICKVEKHWAIVQEHDSHMVLPSKPSPTKVP